MIGRSAIGRSRFGGLCATFSVTLVFSAIATSAVGPNSPDHPITRSPDSHLAGELDAKGLTARIEAEKGNVVLLNFWATWCVPCREEYPELVRLQKSLSAKGLRVIGVSTDFAKQLPAVEAFLAKNRPSFPNYHRKSGGDDQDFINAVDPNWGGELPFSVLYGRDGNRVRTLSGKSSYADFEREVLRVLR